MIEVIFSVDYNKIEKENIRDLFGYPDESGVQYMVENDLQGCAALILPYKLADAYRALTRTSDPALELVGVERDYRYPARPPGWNDQFLFRGRFTGGTDGPALVKKLQEGCYDDWGMAGFFVLESVLHSDPQWNWAKKLIAAQGRRTVASTAKPIPRGTFGAEDVETINRHRRSIGGDPLDLGAGWTVEEIREMAENIRTKGRTHNPGLKRRLMR